MGVGIGPLTLLFFFSSPYHLCLLHVTLILDLVTHCCVCLVFVDGMSGGRMVGLDFVLPFGYGVETFFCLNIFDHQILTLCMWYEI